MKFLLILSFIAATTFAQETGLFISKPIQNAYEKGTRSYDGSPGSNYWQNRANYQIDALVDVVSKELNGSMLLTYFNESPDTLKKIVLKLNQDIYKKGANRDFQISPLSVHDGVKVTKVNVNGDSLDVSVGGKSVVRSGTNMIINLSGPLNPGDNLLIEIDWSFPIPTLSTIRQGAYSDTSMFIGYWYPQAAVYDDIDGWDELDYTGLMETYNNFANYDVKITAPKNFLVWATGELQNPENVLIGEYLEKYKKALESDSTVKIVSREDKNQEITTGIETATWEYKASNTTDFAFALGKNYQWDASSVKLNDGSKVFVDAGYALDSKYFENVEEILREAVKFHSQEMPGLSFPFPATTVFNGSGGMEFPMIINDSETTSYERTVGLTTHEFAHMYFPFCVGTNERRYAFMDEGWAVFLPVELQKRLTESDPLGRRYERYHSQARTITPPPPMVPSFDLDRTSYRMASYTRAGAAYFALQEQLGQELFLKSFQTFIKSWRGKHPTAYDFFFTFEDVSGQDLEWFWRNWFFEFAIAEMELVDYMVTENSKQVTVLNKGGLAIPVVLKIYFADRTEQVHVEKPDVWKNGISRAVINLKTDKKITMITLGSDYFPNISEKTKLNINEQ